MLRESAEVAVLLATYNGAAFLDAQLVSVLNQRAVQLRILAHDDGSSDATPQLLRAYAERHPDVIEVIDAPACGGASANFSFLLEQGLAHRAHFNYFMFCDQDDIWDADKVAVTLEAMRTLEASTPDRPLLVHSDLRVVDAAGAVIASSLCRFQHLNPVWAEKPSLVATQNVVTGCTVMVNRSLAELATPVPDEAIMHDWWIALVAATFGRVAFVPRALISYRQHGNNNLGAQRFDAAYILRKLRFMWDGTERHKSLRQGARQADAFLVRFGAYPEAQPLRGLAGILNHGYPARLWTLWRGRYFKVGWQRNLAWLFLP